MPAGPIAITGFERKLAIINIDVKIIIIMINIFRLNCIDFFILDCKSVILKCS